MLEANNKERNWLLFRKSRESNCLYPRASWSGLVLWSEHGAPHNIAALGTQHADTLIAVLVMPTLAVTEMWGRYLPTSRGWATEWTQKWTSTPNFTLKGTSCPESIFNPQFTYTESAKCGSMST